MTVVPTPAPFAVEAVEGGGRAVVSLTDEPEALVWLDSHDVGGLTEALTAAPGARWIQLSSAGVESMTEVIDQTRIWTCAKGAYAQPVAEHALTLALAGLRLLPTRIAARSWGAQGGTSLFGERVTILGGGGIGRSLLELLAPFEVEATVVNRSGNPVPGAARTMPVSEFDRTLGNALVVVLALSLTPKLVRSSGRSSSASWSRRPGSSMWPVGDTSTPMRWSRLCRRGRLPAPHSMYSTPNHFLPGTLSAGSTMS